VEQGANVNTIRCQKKGGVRVEISTHEHLHTGQDEMTKSRVNQLDKQTKWTIIDDGLFGTQVRATT